MIKQILIVLFFIFCTLTSFATEELQYTRKKTVNLDIELSHIAVTIAVFDGDTIAYRYSLTKGNKLSCIQAGKTFRIRQILPSEGVLHIFIPKKLVIERSLIRLNRAELNAEGIHAVHFSTIVNSGIITVKNCVLKNTMVNIAQGKLTINARIIASCTFSMSDTRANIVFSNDPNTIHLDYSKTNSMLFINSQEQLPLFGEYGNPKGKSRIILSAGSSNTNILFGTVPE